MTLTTLRITNAALRERADVYHLHDSELIPAGLVLKAFGKRVIYDAHEHLPRQMLNKEWIPRRLRQPVAAAANLLEMIADRLFDGIVVANPSTEQRFSPAHTALVENFARMGPNAGHPVPLRQRGISVLYLGGLTAHRGIWQMIDAIRILDRPAARVVLAGPVDPALDLHSVELPSAVIEFPGQLARDEADAALLNSQIGLSVLQPVPNFTEGHYPTKLFEYMAAGMAVVASDFPLYRQVVEQARCGLLVDPSDSGAIAEAIAYLLDHPDEAEVMGARGRAAVIERYTWPIAERSLLQLYGAVLS
jgi:hypothetical protein